MEILALLIIVYALKHAITDTKGAAAKSREAYLKSADNRFPDMPKGKRAAHAARHDLGWGLSQLGHGLPATRHGFMTGWHQSRQAHHQAMLGRQEAKTAHLETKASAAGQLKDYRARQQAALEEIRSGKASGKRGWLVTGMPEPKEGTSPGPEEEGTPEGTSPEPVSTRRVDGKPETEADKKFFDLRESGYEGPIDQDGNIPDPDDPAVAILKDMGNVSPTGTTVTEDHWDDPLPGEEGSPAPEEGTPEGTSSSTPETSPTSTASTEGTKMADTSYSQIHADMDRDNQHAEQAAAEQRQVAVQQENAHNEAQAAMTRTNATVDAASEVEVDAATQSALMEHADAQRLAAEAHAHAHEATQSAEGANVRVQETAEQVKAALSRHAVLAQAHQDSPVEAADKEFYQEA